MEVWTVVFGVVLGLVLLQVAVYRYLGAGREPLVDREPSARSSAGDEDPRFREGHDPVDTSTAGLAGVVERPSAAGPRHCPHCGVENEPEPGFTFCWNCAGRLA
ncbi:hypothetical protein ACFO0N_16385 [Halobium salinum]|uniref:DUF7577 domain-containing protein n=1 Tax=Halobium salinum TaxID=1364940 RepID=A0ABD5PFH4_9EURY|nr:hypothetical protein [Halobium salinum]